MVEEQREKARRQTSVEDRIEQEFRRAIGGIPAIERMRTEFRSKYADNPSLQDYIDRLADRLRRELEAEEA